MKGLVTTMEERFFFDTHEIIFVNMKKDGPEYVNLPASTITSIVIAPHTYKRLLGLIKKEERAITIQSTLRSDALFMAEHEDPRFEKYMTQLKEFAAKNYISLRDSTDEMASKAVDGEQ